MINIEDSGNIQKQNVFLYERGVISPFVCLKNVRQKRSVVCVVFTFVSPFFCTCVCLCVVLLFTFVFVNHVYFLWSNSTNLQPLGKKYGGEMENGEPKNV